MSTMLSTEIVGNFSIITKVHFSADELIYKTKIQKQVQLRERTSLNAKQGS